MTEVHNVLNTAIQSLWTQGSPTEVFSGVAAAAKQLWEVAPPEVRDAAPFLLSCGAQVATTVEVQQSIVAPLSEIMNSLNNRSYMSTTAANNLLETCCEISVIKNNQTEICTLLTDPAAGGSREHISQQLEKSLRGTCNGLMIWAAVTNFICLISESIRLWNFWEAVKDAKNIELSSQTRNDIQDSLKEILVRLNQLNIDVEAINGGNSTERMRCRVSQQIDGIRSSLNSLERDIGSLKVEIDKKVVRLGQARRQAKMSVVNCVTSGAMGFVNVATLAGMTNPWLAGATAVFGALNLVLTFGNIYASLISSDVLKDIETELYKIKKLETEIQSVQLRFQDMATEAWDIIMKEAVE